MLEASERDSRVGTKIIISEQKSFFPRKPIDGLHITIYDNIIIFYSARRYRVGNNVCTLQHYYCIIIMCVCMCMIIIVYFTCVGRYHVSWEEGVAG